MNNISYVKKAKHPMKIISKQYFKTLKLLDDYKNLEDSCFTQIWKQDPLFLNAVTLKDKNYFFTKYWVYIESTESSILKPKQMMDTYGRAINYKQVKQVLKKLIKTVHKELKITNNCITYNTVEELKKCMLDSKEYPSLNLMNGYAISPDIVNRWLLNKPYTYKVSKSKKFCIVFEDNIIRMIIALMYKGSPLHK